jgi:hypothetical protein
MQPFNTSASVVAFPTSSAAATTLGERTGPLAISILHTSQNCFSLPKTEHTTILTLRAHQMPISESETSSIKHRFPTLQHTFWCWCYRNWFIKWTQRVHHCGFTRPWNQQVCSSSRKVPFVTEVGKFTSENWVLYMNVMWSISLLRSVREKSEEFSWGLKLKQ